MLSPIDIFITIFVGSLLWISVIWLSNKLTDQKLTNDQIINIGVVSFLISYAIMGIFAYMGIVKAKRLLDDAIKKTPDFKKWKESGLNIDDYFNN